MHCRVMGSSKVDRLTMLGTYQQELLFGQNQVARFEAVYVFYNTIVTELDVPKVKVL